MTWLTSKFQSPRSAERHRAPVKKTHISGFRSLAFAVVFAVVLFCVLRILVKAGLALWMLYGTFLPAGAGQDGKTGAILLVHLTENQAKDGSDALTTSMSD